MGLVGAGAAWCSLLVAIIFIIFIITWKRCKVKNTRKKYNLEMVYQKQMEPPDFGMNVRRRRSVGQEDSERVVMAEVGLSEGHLKLDPPTRANDGENTSMMKLDTDAVKTGEYRTTNEADDEPTHGQLMREIKAYKHGSSVKYRYKLRKSDKM